MEYLIIFFYKKMNNSYLFTAKSRQCTFTSWRRSLLLLATSERTNLNIPLFKEDFCSNIQSWKKISHQNEVETRLVQVMIDAPFDSRVY